MKRSGDEWEIGESASASPGRVGEVERGRQWRGCVGLEMPDVSASIMVESSSGRGKLEGRWMQAWRD